MDDVTRHGEGPLPHDPSCPRCGHPLHTYLPCGGRCDCPPTTLPATVRPPGMDDDLKAC